jgi:PDZ domain-containing protein
VPPGTPYSPADGDVPVAPRRRRRWPAWVGGISVLLVGGVIAALIFIRVPYVTVAPGSATPTEHLVSVEGAEAYPAEGEVLFTTVSVNGHVQLWRALQGWLDPAIAVRPEEIIRGDRDEDEDRAYNLALMDNSKTTAVQVALEYLGYDVSAHGSLIASVVPDTDAAEKLEPGDVITAIDGTPVEFGTDLRAGITAHRPGETVHLRVDPSAGDKPARETDVILSHQPADANQPMLGVEIQDYRVEFPIDVSIDSGSVGGPSAGLAFTLAVLDVLTPGELTGGGNVAVTGTIDEDGNVGPVGGVTQKTEAVKRAGAKYFLVPPDEFADASRAAGDDLQVVQVATLDEALHFLAGIGGNADALPRAAGAPAA